MTQVSLLIFAILQVFQVHSEKVLRITPYQEKQIEFLRNLKRNAKDKIDFWKEPSHIGNPVELQIHDSDYARMKRLLRHHHIAHIVQIPDVWRLIALQMKALKHAVIIGDSEDFHSNYHTLDQITRKMNAIAAAYPARTQIHNLGKSYEQRDMLAIEIRGAARSNKSVFFWECGIHAREWIAPATCMYAVDKLASLYGKDANVTATLDKMDMIILPVLNVDGYIYTHTTDRLWRKNRRPNPNSYCTGTDLNRNWGLEWGGGGSSSNPCSNTYRGPSPFSEPELKNIKAFLKKLGSRLQGFVDMHSFGQMWFIPWGYTKNKTEDYNEQYRVAKVASNAIANAGYNTQYTYGSSAIMLYIAAGGAEDWTYGHLRVKYSFSVELRGTIQHGFLLPPGQIKPTGKETLQGMMALIAAMEV